MKACSVKTDSFIRSANKVETLLLFLLISGYFVDLILYRGNEIKQNQYLQISQTLLFSSVIFVFSFTDGKGWFTRLLGNDFCLRLGSVSLYIYLFHHIVTHCGMLNVIMNAFNKYGEPLLYLGCALIFVITLILSFGFNYIQNHVKSYFNKIRGVNI